MINNVIARRIQLYVLSLVCFLCVSTHSHAELIIEITEGVDNPTPIAVVPFDGGSSLPENISSIVSSDLARSGLFAAKDPKNMLSFPSKAEDIFYRDWRISGVDYLVIGNVKPTANGFISQYGLYDVNAQRQIFSKITSSSQNGLRDIAHTISDEIYFALTGIRGAFSTEILYIEDLRKDGPGRYRLVKADADGAREKVLFKSSQPLLSPTWSNDLSKVAYVSFETSRPAIFMQELATGRRTQLTNFKGLNGAPAFSPDDKRMAMVLSKDGNPELYVMDIASKRFTRITRTSSAVIDTEPNWTNDGQSLIFTSNRGGSPQVYQINLSTNRIERLTFDGNYNARPRLTPDGKNLIMVHREQSVFHIAWQNIASGDIRILTQTSLDESPTVAPNGASLLYATKYRGKGILAAVSIDAGGKVRFPSKRGDVREPAWSPYRKK